MSRLSATAKNQETKEKMITTRRQFLTAATSVAASVVFPSAYGAAYPEARPYALVLAIVGKATFIGLVLAHGGRYLRTTGLFLVIDAIFVVAFAAYLLATA